jgi:Arc/MetJ-type ribon-helix-helix transcriptional regulator
MKTKRMSISLSDSLIFFVEKYQIEKGFQTTTEVIEEALQLLKERELENAYKEASKDVETDWDILAGDGLEDETW